MKKHLLFLSVIAFVLFALTNCGQNNGQETKASQSVSQLDELLNKYADVVAEMPAHPKTSEALEQFRNAATALAKDKDEDAWDVLINLCADNNVGVCALDKKVSEIAGKDKASLAQWLSKIRQDHSGAMVSLAAFDRELGIRMESSSDSFLDACREIINRDSKDKMASIAMLRRGDYYSAHGKLKEAGFDRIRFWSCWPDKVTDAGLKARFTADLARAGFVLESDILSSATHPDKTAEILLTKLTASWERLAKDSEPKSSEDAYTAFSPDYGKVEAASSSDSSYASASSAMAMARLLRLAANAMDGVKIKTQCVGFAKGMANFDPAQAEIDDLAILAQMCGAVAEICSGAFGLENRPATINANAAQAGVGLPTQAALTASVVSIRKSQMGLFNAILDRASDLDKSTVSIDEMVAVAKKREDKKAVTQAYEKFIQMHEGSEITPNYLIALGDYYFREMDAPAKALEAYRTIQKSYSNSSVAQRALYDQATCLYKLKKYDEAFTIAHDELAKNAETPIRADLLFMQALCERELGMNDESVIHFGEIVSNYPKSAMAERAMFLLGSIRIEKQQYPEAMQVFNDMLQRYPQSSYASKAKEYIKRIEAFVTPSEKK
jgi:TolA-binding protein